MKVDAGKPLPLIPLNRHTRYQWVCSGATDSPAHTHCVNPRVRHLALQKTPGSCSRAFHEMQTALNNEESLW